MTATVVASDALVDDVTVWPAMEALISCLCQQLVTSGLPPVCICSPMPGEVIAADYVSEDAGMAWVRLENTYPSTQFPGPDSVAGCLAPLAFTVELGVLYCAPLPTDQGEPPGLIEQFDSTRVQLAAMAAMRRAIQCCFPGSRRDVVLGVYSPSGPEGGVVGGSWSIFIAEGATHG